MKKKAFTLVELMVVIAIIAILAVGSINSYSAYIEKANFSKTLQFSKNIYSQLYTGSKSIYSFGEGNGTTTESTGLAENTGTLYNGAEWADDLLLKNNGGSLELDGIDDYVSFPRGNTEEPTQTISLWIDIEEEITATSAYRALIEFYNPADSSGSGSGAGAVLWTGASTSYCANETIAITGGWGNLAGRLCGYTDISEGKHHILITWNDTEYNIYIDGEEILTDDGNGNPLLLNNQSIRRIGNRQHGSAVTHFKGKIDEIALFSESYIQ